jgi:hypothetical protein
MIGPGITVSIFVIRIAPSVTGVGGRYIISRGGIPGIDDFITVGADVELFFLLMAISRD